MTTIKRLSVAFVLLAIIGGSLMAAPAAATQGLEDQRTAARRDSDSLSSADGVGRVPDEPKVTAAPAASVTVFTENFDGVAAPALPAGWTTQRTGSAPPPFFATGASTANSAPNAVFTNGALSSTNSLLSPAIALPAGMSGFRLSFAQTRNFEAIGPAVFDGGILELSTNGGATFNNVTSAAVGGSFTAGGYNGTVNAGGNPIAPSQAWCASQSTFAVSTLSLPGSLSGQTVIFRWRAGWDGSGVASNPNWVIDSVVLTATIDLTVNSTADPGDGVCNPAECTLREAINTAVAGDTIPFAAALFSTPQTITLTAGELNINKDLTITGPGANLLTISGNNASIVFNIASGANAAIGGVRITGGNSSANGGGIANNGTLNLTNSTVSGNSAANGGGGIANFATMNLTNSTVSGNSAANAGGGITNFATMNLTNSTVSGNTATNAGGGIANTGTMNLTNSTVSGNTAGNNGGGGISNLSTVNVTNSTISSNSASGGGGGGINTIGSTFRARNTIISGNTANSNADLAGTPAVNENNLIGGNTGLQPLGDYGGTTRTHALASGSPAINAGNNCVLTQACATFNAPVAVATDQRGRTRVGQVDIGAFETQPNLVVTKTADTDDGVCDSDCSLREAIAVAPAGDRITFASPLFDSAQTIEINNQLTINRSVFIDGRGPELTTVRSIRPASNFSRVFVTLAGTINFSGLTISGARLTVGTSAPACNVACGGGILNLTDLSIANSTITDNVAGTTGGGLGGGIYSTGTLKIVDSTISNNNANGSNEGGGIYVHSGSAKFSRITVAGNLGGGILLRSGLADADNITVSNNSGTISGAGIFMSSGTFNLTNSTITQNRSSNTGGGISGPGFAIRNSIIAGNTAAAFPNAYGNLTVNENSIIDNEAAVRLAPLGNYGGTTMTHPVLAGSTAINAGNNCVLTGTCATFNAPSLLTLDQRGAARVGNVDIGAFEVNNSANGGTFKAVLPTGRTGLAYSQTLIPTLPGGATYGVTSGALPNGVTLGGTPLAGLEENAINAPQAGVGLSGTPTVGGTFNFTITLNSGGNTTATDYQMLVNVPTSAGVSVEGRVTTANGRGVANAFVILTDATGQVRTVKTAALGYFRFEDVAAGQTVVLNVKSRKFSFAPKVVFLADNIAGLDLVGTR